MVSISPRRFRGRHPLGRDGGPLSDGRRLGTRPDPRAADVVGKGRRIEDCKDGDDRWVKLAAPTALEALRTHLETIELEAQVAAGAMTSGSWSSRTPSAGSLGSARFSRSPGFPS